MKERRRRRKKKRPNSQPGEERGKKKESKVVKSWVLFVGPSCVFNYNIVNEL